MPFLQGSFGDNELSPECLDGAQRFLKPDGISIPTAYTSQLQPIAAFRVWSDVKVTFPLQECIQACQTACACTVTVQSAHTYMM